MASQSALAQARPSTQERLKPSQYNVFSERPDYVWAFNARSNALAKLTHDEFRTAGSILHGKNPDFDRPEDRTLRDFLISGQFLIPDELDELSLLKVKNNLVRFGSRGVGLIIAPTLRCNFGCEYCYVDLNANKMSRDVRDRTKRFFEKRLDEGCSSTVTWTGGDPSLAMDVVADLSEHFIAVCKDRHATYWAMMITNGYLLDAKMVQRARDCQIKVLQITIDGNRATHDSRRPLAGGKPTYDRILDNIASACNDIEIVIRMNIDQENVDALEEVFADLRSRGAAQKVSVFFAQVEAVNEQCKSYAYKCLSKRDFALAHSRLTRTAREYGIQVDSEKPQLRNEFCGANSTNFFVIDSNGSLLRCYQDFGTADVNRIGFIGPDGREVIDKPDNLLRWLSWDPFSIDECRNCKVLPLCMGGCSYDRVRHGEGAELGCISIKFALDEFLEAYGESHAQGRAGCGSCSRM